MINCDWIEDFSHSRSWYPVAALLVVRSALYISCDTISANAYAPQSITL